MAGKVSEADAYCNDDVVVGEVEDEAMGRQTI